MPAFISKWWDYDFSWRLPTVVGHIFVMNLDHIIICFYLNILVDNKYILESIFRCLDGSYNISVCNSSKSVLFFFKLK